MLPTKDMQGKHLLFLTILENQDGKTIEMVRKQTTKTKILNLLLCIFVVIKL